MKKSTQIFLLTLVALMAVLDLCAQNSTYERQPGYWTLGLNGGLDYQQADVPTTLDGWGAGITLGKNLYYRPGSVFAFDLRGRALYAQSYGLDYQRSYGIQRNDALNGTENLDYTKDGGQEGFVFQNNKTHFGELGLEGVLHFNKLREQTNINLSLFGGIGIGGFATSIDQKDENGNLYTSAYMGIDTTASRSAIRKELRNAILDGVYETDAQDFGVINFMPGAGIELGYQLTPKFSIGIGHKVTFTGSDLFDGNQFNNDNSLTGENDWNHYTNLHLRWIIDPKEKKEPGPDVDIINPLSKKHTSKSRNGFVRARILNVNNAMEIDLLVNGKNTPFEFENTYLKSEFVLERGANEVVVKAYNQAGSDQESVTIYYQPEEEKIDYDNEVIDQPRNEVDPTPSVSPPTVKFTRPYRNTETVANDRYTVKAEITKVNDKDDIYFTVNGRSVNNFYFRGNRFESDIILRDGNNRLKLEVRNEGGTRTDNATIVLDIPKIIRPTVTITRPSRNPYTTQQSRERIEATINVDDNGCNILYKVNGRSISKYDFRNGRFSADADLKEGRNKIEVFASVGNITESDETFIIYERPYVPQQLPEVNITTPSRNNQATRNPKAPIKATITNVSQKRDIRFLVNGRNSNDFDFRNGRFSGTAQLRMGNNDIEIEARNEDGSDSDRVSIKLEKEVIIQQRPPSVKITVPTASKTTDAQITMRATVTQVSSKNDIIVELNGRAVSFGFDQGRGSVSANLNLRTGRNDILVKAQNRDGRDEDRHTITYEKLVSPPRVTISIPRNNATIKVSKISFKGTVTNVEGKNDVELLLNGKRISNFNYNSGIITANMVTKKGRNTIELKASNAGGRDQASVNVTYVPEVIVPKPEVKFVKPNKSITVKESRYNISASIKNVVDEKDMKLQVNGKSIPFEFNARKRVLTGTAVLRNGANSVVVTATNISGSASDEVSITRSQIEDKGKVVIGKVKLKKPTINSFTASQPTANPFSPNEARTRITAMLSNVSKSSEIKLTLNGTAVTNFEYNASTGRMTVVVTIGRGTSTAKVTATTRGGTVEKTTSVTF